MSGNVPVAVEYELGALELQQKSIREQLDILRQTRGQRNVGELTVPTHLRTPDTVVVPASAAANVDPRSCRACSRGLSTFELQRGMKICLRCASDPTTDAGVESRADRAAILPE